MWMTAVRFCLSPSLQSTSLEAEEASNSLNLSTSSGFRYEALELKQNEDARRFIA